MSIEAQSPVHVEEKLTAFKSLSVALDHDDLINVINLVVENPTIVEFIKSAIPEDGKELTEGDYASLITRAIAKFS